MWDVMQNEGLVRRDKTSTTTAWRIGRLRLSVGLANGTHRKSFVMRISKARDIPKEESLR